MRGPAARVGLGLMATALALAAAEALLGGPLRPALTHARDAAWREQLDAMHRALHRADPALVYAPRPGAAVQMPYGRAAFNAQGLREDHPVAATPGPDHRVVVLGDSLVWGELLAREEAIPAALDRALGPGFEVLNAGVTGYATAQEAAWYRRAVRPLSPDTVVLVFCLNDLLTFSGPFHHHASSAQRSAYAAERAWLEAAAPVRNETVSALWWAERSGEGSQLAAAARHLWRWHRLFTLPGGYTDEFLIAAGDPQRVAAVGAALDRLGEDLRADGVRPILVISPGLYWWHRYPWAGVHAAVRDRGEAAGFSVLDPLPAWAEDDPEPFRFPGDNLHYTAYGAERLAAEVAPIVRAGASR